MEAPSRQPPPLHPAIAPLSYFLGTWRGQGEGAYPTISSFPYGEELHFSHSGKVLLFILISSLFSHNSELLGSVNGHIFIYITVVMYCNGGSACDSLYSEDMEA